MRKVDGAGARKNYGVVKGKKGALSQGGACESG